MNSETKNCQNCKTDFTIEPEDFAFYEKIKVPAPTFCVDCAHQRRFSFRNTHSFYKRKDAFTGKDILSIYSPDKNLVVIDQKDWWGDSWDPMDYARDYDFTQPFFQQWKEFRDTFPLQSLSNSKAVNSEYCNVALESLDSYLVSASWNCERVLYSDSVTAIKDSADIHVVSRSEFCYWDVSCADSYKLLYSQDSSTCADSYFLYDCKGCSNCFMSSNIRNKSYVFRNQQLSKEQYLEKIKEIDFGSREIIEHLKKEFSSLKEHAVHRFAHISNSYNSTGNDSSNIKNCKNCFNITDGAEDCKNVFWGGMNAKEMYNSGPGIGSGQLMYEVTDTGLNGNRNLFTSVVYGGLNIEYAFNCYNCAHVFGCIGLRNKKYCIFNKQYSKEEFEELVPKIKQHMMDMPYVDGAGLVYRYGEFFPSEFSPFCYNETVAQDYFPLTQEQAKQKSLSWKEKDTKGYVPTMNASELPDNIHDVTDEILKEIIQCAHEGVCEDRCSTAFKVTKDELAFYKRMNIPLPHLCYGCRHAERFKMRNPIKLWHRSCMCDIQNHDHDGKCPNEFETSYAPDRSEKVFCEGCYQKEVL